MKFRKLIPVLFIFILFTACQKANRDGMKIMTFNIRYGTALDGENSWEQRKYLVIDCLEKYQPDILGVQEAHDYQVEFIKSAFSRWKAFGVGRYHTVPEPDRPQESMKGESCTIFYDAAKFMLKEQSTFWHSDTPQVPGSKVWGNTYPRITTWGIFERYSDASRFVVMNTHFGGKELYVTNTARLSLLKWREIGGSLPAVFMGDFNLVPESETHELFCGRSGPADLRGNFIDCWQALGKPEQDAGTGHNYTGTKSGTRIDWILVTPDFVVRDVNIIHDHTKGRYPSDHYPVLAELELN